MRHYPVFLDTRGQKIVVSGGGHCAAAKLRLLLKTESRIAVFGNAVCQEVAAWAQEGRLDLVPRALMAGDVAGARLFYAANDDANEDARVAAIAEAEGALVSVVDNLEDSAFITPAIVDRDPVTVAIGTEGAAPVLARRIKKDVEERLPQSLGLLARAGQAFRDLAEVLPQGRVRRSFWACWYDRIGPAAFASGGQDALEPALHTLLHSALHAEAASGRVALIGAGPGDPDLLTLAARDWLHEADVVIHDRLVSPEVLELARREALVIEVGKTPDGPSWKQDDINSLLVTHAAQGARVARLKSGDPGMFGRLDEEIAALDAAEIPYQVIPGITAASAAAASLGLSLTRRGRNSALRVLTGRDVEGFAEQDWAALAAGDVAAIYMGVKAARFVQGRMLLHGADADLPVTVVENVSRLTQKNLTTRLGSLVRDMATAKITGPAIIFLGLARETALPAVIPTPKPIQTHHHPRPALSSGAVAFSPDRRL